MLIMWIYLIITSVYFTSKGTFAAPCEDTISTTKPYTFVIGIRLISVTSCAQLVREYSAVCRNQTVAGRVCCQQCQKVKDLSCVDGFQRPDTSFRYTEQFLSCNEYIREDACRCHSPDVKDSCCYSCKNINTIQKDCACRNLFNLKLRPAYQIKIFIYYGLINEVSKSITSCSDFSKWYPSFCFGPKFHRIQQKCCKTCKKVELPCVDNLLWTTSVSLNNNIHCKGCNCHQIRQKSTALMKRVCSRNMQGTSTATQGTRVKVGARTACCYQCYRLGFGTPKDYSGEDNRVVRADLHKISTYFDM